MKKLNFSILSLTAILLLTGCSPQPKPETAVLQPQEIAAAVIKSQTSLPMLNQIAYDDDDFSLYLSDYRLSEEQVEDGVICYADGVEASEIAVFLLTQETDADTVQSALTDYIKDRAGVFEGYAPEQAALARKGAAVASGRYTALLICPDMSAAKTSFTSCFKAAEETKSATAETKSAIVEAKFTEATGAGFSSSSETTEAGDDSYNPAAILKAWRSGDDTELSDTNRLILQAAEEVIQNEINSSMTDYEKELAIHDWITGWSSFDYRVFSRGSSGRQDDASETPYGVFIDRSAMCHGYSSTFQLLMDMLDIECITVYGTPGSNGVSHSWNMVKLDDEWYCVDVAWDDPIGGTPSHSYFNVTSQFLKNGGIHRWDESSVPTASATAYSYKYR